MVSRLKRFLASHRDGYNGKNLYAMDHSRRSESVNAIRQCTHIFLDEHVDDEVRVDACALALGNGTTFSGMGRAVQERNLEAELIGVEPAEAPWFYVQKYGEEQLRAEHGIEPENHQHNLLGTGGWGVEFPNMDSGLLDEVQLVFEQEWQCMLDQLHGAGYYVGHSSAACQWVAQKRSNAYHLNGQGERTFLGIFYDPIRKY